MGVDPLADKYSSWNPYHYVHNNPLRMTDPNGMEADDIIYRDEKTREEVYRIPQVGDHQFVDVAIVDISDVSNTSKHNQTSLAPTVVNAASMAATASQDYYNSLGHFKPTGTTSVPTQNGLYKAKNNKMYPYDHQPNQHTGPRSSWEPMYSNTKSTAITPTNKMIGIKLTKFAGLALTGAGMAMTQGQYQSGQINGYQYSAEMGMSAATTIPNPYTMAAGVGWELGRLVTMIPAYRRRVHPYEFENEITMPKK